MQELGPVHETIAAVIAGLPVRNHLYTEVLQAHLFCLGTYGEIFLG